MTPDDMTPAVPDASTPAPEPAPAAPIPAPDQAPTAPETPHPVAETAPAPSAAQPAPPQPFQAQPYGAQPSQPYGAQPYGAPAYGFPAQQSAPQGLSITSMVCGITSVVLSFFVFGLMFGIAAVIFGHIAQRREPQARGLWATGLITGYVGAALSFVIGTLTILGFLIPFLAVMLATSSV